MGTSPIESDDIEHITDLYNETLNVLESEEGHRDLCIQVMHELGNLMYYTSNTKWVHVHIHVCK